MRLEQDERRHFPQLDTSALHDRFAHASDETGSYEIYVQSFSADGQLAADKKTVLKTGGTEFEFTAPRPLFKTRILSPIGNFHEFDVTPDGKRFLIGTLIGDTKAAPPTVIMNWTAWLKK